MGLELWGYLVTFGKRVQFFPEALQDLFDLTVGSTTFLLNNICLGEVENFTNSHGQCTRSSIPIISRDSPFQAAADLIKSGRFSELAMIASAASYYIQ